MVTRISEGTMCLSRYIIPIIFKILEAILFMCGSHLKCLCIVKPKKLNSSANSILIFSISIFFNLLILNIIFLKYNYQKPPMWSMK